MLEFITRMFNKPTEEEEVRSAWYGTLEGSALLTPGDRFTNHGFVNACIKVIAETVAVIPFRVYKKDEDGRELQSDDHRDYLLSTRPNDDLSSTVFLESLVRDLLEEGNAYVKMHKNYRGDIKSLHIIPAKDVDIRKEPYDDKLYYYVDGQPVDKTNLIHIPVNPDVYGIGRSPVTIARENIGLSSDAMEFAKAFYRNGGGLRSFLSTSQKLSDKTLARLEKNYRGKFSGVANAHTVPILEEGLELKSLTASLQDSLFLDSRKFEEQEIATIFRIPISKLNMLDRSTHNNIEQQQLDFLTDTIMPYIVKIEKELTYKMFKSTESDHYVKGEVRAILRADMITRSTYYKSMFNMGAYSINEIRALEEANSMDNLDGHYLNAATSLIDEDGNLTVQKAGLTDSNEETVEGEKDTFDDVDKDDQNEDNK